MVASDMPLNFVVDLPIVNLDRENVTVMRSSCIKDQVSQVDLFKDA